MDNQRGTLCNSHGKMSATAGIRNRREFQLVVGLDRIGMAMMMATRIVIALIMFCRFRAAAAILGVVMETGRIPASQAQADRRRS